MKRHPTLIPISREHHQVLLLAQLLKKDAPLYRGLPDTLDGKLEYALTKYQDLLLLHLKRDQESLYPYLSQWPELSDLLEELMAKSHWMIRVFEMLDKSVTAEELDQIGHTLEHYVRTKERKLFQTVQELLDETEMLMLGKEISRHS